MSESEAIKAIFGDVIRDAVRDALQELKPEEPEKAKDKFYTRDDSMCSLLFLIKPIVEAASMIPAQ